ncbi:hypothetical protein LSAT2_014848, partial [Lamellibrachia satsuma]
MEPHVFNVLLGTLCVCQLMSVGGQVNSGSNDGLLHDDTTTGREATGAPELRRAHGGNGRSPVPDTDVAPSLGRMSARRRRQTPGWCHLRNKCRVGQNTYFLDFKYRNCFCDNLCHTYGDCCKDAIRPSSSPVGSRQLSNIRYYSVVVSYSKYETVDED